MKLDITKIQKDKPITELINFGIINIDKPSGPTSFWVDNYVRKALGLTKVSHAGTLDPKVTGVLPLMLGRTCKLLGYFMGHNKTYVGVMRLHADGVTEERLDEEIKKFLGVINQMPPVKSRVKRQLREREIVCFKVLERKDKDILFETEVQAGTYIRKLCDDMGVNLGGAHMLELRRTKASIFEEGEKNNNLKATSKIFTLYQFDEAVKEWKEKNNDKLLRAMITPGEVITQVLPTVFAKNEYQKQLRTGKRLNNEMVVSGKWDKEEVFCAFIKESFLGIYEGQSKEEARARFVWN
ncbi:MAG: RNA-guided pseudouridylation complex pseudouridine synthase subunit Cbf5 [Nanoarchaeota archaeon]